MRELVIIILITLMTISVSSCIIDLSEKGDNPPMKWNN